MQAVLADYEALRAQAREGGGKEVLDRWKSRGKGKMGVRERFVRLHSIETADTYGERAE